MAQHALGCEDDEWLAPRTARLPAQHMKILRSRRRLANLHIVSGAAMHETLQPRAGMLWSLARVGELVADDLCAVGEIPELRFPQNERLGIVAAKSVFEPQATRLGKRRVENLAESLLLGKVRES